MKIRDVMNKRLPMTTPGVSIVDAAAEMKTKDIGSLLVRDGQRIVGIITQSDLVRKIIAKGKSPEGLKVSDIMSKPLIMVDSDDEISDAVRLLNKYQIQRLGVMEKGKVVGIISTRRIVEHFSEILKK